MKTRVIKPVVSEKSFQQASVRKYTFLVDALSNKMQIKDEIERIFKVNVISVNTSKKFGKVKRTKGVVGKRPDFKKAIVTVDAKSKIDLFEIEEEKKTKGQNVEKTEKEKKKSTKKAKKEDKDVTVNIKKS